MTHTITLDPKQPRVAVGQTFQIYKLGKIIGSATVLSTKEYDVNLEFELEAPYKIGNPPKQLSSESTESSADGFILFKDFKYYIGIED